MKKEYWFVLMVYLFMQFSSVLGVPAIAWIGKIFGFNQSLSYPIWLVIKFVLAFAATLFILRKELKDLSFTKGKKPFKFSIKWALFGVLLAFLAQYAAMIIERLFGIKLVSENTQTLEHIIAAFPFAVIVSSLLGPALEEIIFRGILLKVFHKRFNFFIAASMSSFIFSLAHMDPTHIIRYFAIGLIFAFLYKKRNNILSPIFSHVMMNTIVVMLQLR